MIDATSGTTSVQGEFINYVGKLTVDSSENFLDSIRVMSHLNNNAVTEAAQATGLSLSSEAGIQKLHKMALAMSSDGVITYRVNQNGDAVDANGNLAPKNPETGDYYRRDFDNAKGVLVDANGAPLSTSFYDNLNSPTNYLSNAPAGIRAEAAELNRLGYDLLQKAGVEVKGNESLYAGLMTGSLPMEQAVAAIEWLVTRTEISSAQGAKLAKTIIGLIKSIISKLQG